MCTAYQGPPYQSRRAARRRRAGRAAAGPLRASTAVRRAVMRGTPAPTTLDPRPDPARRTGNQAVKRSHRYSDLFRLIKKELVHKEEQARNSKHAFKKKDMAL